MNQWTKEQFTNESLAVPFQRISPETWMQRRNIQKMLTVDEDPQVYYTCESRTISNDVYDQLMSELDSPAQTQSNNYQLDILEALTDLYEMIGGV